MAHLSRIIHHWNGTPTDLTSRCSFRSWPFKPPALYTWPWVDFRRTHASKPQGPWGEVVGTATVKLPRLLSKNGSGVTGPTNCFAIQQLARWSYLQASASEPFGSLQNSVSTATCASGPSPFLPFLPFSPWLCGGHGRTASGALPAWQLRSSAKELQLIL